MRTEVDPTTAYAYWLRTCTRNNEVWAFKRGLRTTVNAQAFRFRPQSGLWAHSMIESAIFNERHS